MSAAKLSFGGEELHLLPQRAIWWPAQNALIVADLHLGKGAAFRSAGLPVPAGSTTKSLSQIDQLILETGARQLLILGDFWHARAGRSDEIHDSISRWRAANNQIQMLLVRGNHDRFSGRLLPDWKIDEVDPPHAFGSLTLAHSSDCGGDGFVLAGHVHPVFCVPDYDRSIVRVPCFVVDEHCIVLPALGAFTGGYSVSAQIGREIFLATGSSVVRVPQRAA